MGAVAVQCRDRARQGFDEVLGCPHGQMVGVSIDDAPVAHSRARVVGADGRVEVHEPSPRCRGGVSDLIALARLA